MSHTIPQKRNFSSALTNEKLTGMLNAKGTILKKIFHSLFISVLLNTASVSILFEHSSHFEEKLMFHSLFISILVNTASI